MSNSDFDIAAVLGAQVSKSDTDGKSKMLNIDLLDLNPLNFFKVEDDITDLCESIQLNGLLQPLVVTPAAEGHYRVIAGHRRLAALKKLAEIDKQFLTAPCMVVHPANEDDEQIMLIQTNTEAREIGWNEKSKAAEIIEAILVRKQKAGVVLPGKMRTNVAKIIKTSESQLARAKYIKEHLTKEAKDLGRSDDVCYRLAHLPEEQQREIVAHYKKESWKLDAGAVKDYTENLTAGRKPFYREPTVPQPRTCYEAPHKGEYKKCTYCDQLKARKNDSSISDDEKCGSRGDYACCTDCCRYVECADACPVLSGKIKKLKTNINYKIGRQIKIACDDVGMSKLDLAKKVNESSADMITRYENGLFAISAEKIEAFAIALDVPMSQLFGEKPVEIQQAPRKAVRWEGRGLTPPENRPIITEDSTNNGKKYTPAMWTGSNFVDPGNPKKELTGLNFIRWIEIPDPDSCEDYNLDYVKPNSQLMICGWMPGGTLPSNPCEVLVDFDLGEPSHHIVSRICSFDGHKFLFGKKDPVELQPVRWMQIPLRGEKNEL